MSDQDLFTALGLEQKDEVGRGAQSIVYKASKNNELYALKLQREKNLGDIVYKQYQREASVLGRLKHNSLIQILDVGQEDGRAYMVQEFAKGTTLSAYIEKVGGRLSETDSVTIAIALSEALSKAHALGVVHMDVKPQNIMILDPTNVKLVDFGFAGKRGQDTKEAGIVGTLLYAAPEMTGMLKRPIDGKSDLYCLGVVIFECLTGQTPYPASDVGELMRLHLAAKIPNPRELNPQISPQLAAIVMKLMNKDPDDRYQSAAGLAADLRNIATIDPSALDRESDAFLSKYGTAFVGRENETALLKRRLQQAMDCHGCMVVIEGEPGAGKSRLVSELLIDLKRKEKKSVILAGKCSLNDPMPLGPFREALQNYIIQTKNQSTEAKTQDHERLKKAAGEFAPLMKGFHPELTKIFGEIQEAEIKGQEQFYEAIAHFFTSLANLLKEEQRTMVILIDDIQWLDDASFEILRRLSISLPKTSLFVAGTARNDADSIAAVERFKTDNVISTVLKEKVTLSLLKEEEVKQLIAATLGLTAATDVDEKLSAEIVTRSNGNAFTASEFLYAMLEEGVISPYWNNWKFHQAKLEKVQLPKDVIQLVVKRLESLSEKTQKVLQISSLLGAPFKLKHLVRISQDEAGVHAAISEATEKHLITRNEAGNYVFVHDRVQEALLSKLTAEDQKNLHDHAAETMEKDPEEGMEFVFALAKHYALGQRKDTKRIYSANFKAAIVAFQNFAIEESYRFLQTARSELERDSSLYTSELDELLGAVSYQLMDVTGSIKAYERALASAKDKALKIRICSDYGDKLNKSWRMTRSWEVTCQGVVECGAPQPQTNFIYFLRSVPYGVLALFLNMTKLFKRPGKNTRRHAYLTELYRNATETLYFQQPIALMGTYMRFLYHSYLSRRQDATAYSFLLLAFGMGLIFGFKKLADYFAELSVQIAERSGDRSLVARCLSLQGMIVPCVGDIKRADQIREKAFQKYRTWNGFGIASSCESAHAWELNIRGYSREARRLEIESMRGSPKNAHFTNMPTITAKQSLALAALGKPLEAAELLKMVDQCLDGAERYRFLVYYGCQMFLALEQGETGKVLDDLCDNAKKHLTWAGTEIVYGRLNYITIMYARINQCIEAKTPAEFKKRFNQLKLAMHHMWLASIAASFFRPHKAIGEAYVQYLQGKFQNCRKEIDKTRLIATQFDSPWPYFEAMKLSARCYRKQGNEIAALREAKLALLLASQHAWLNRSRAIRQEFGIEDMNFGKSSSLSATSGDRTIGAATVGAKSTVHGGGVGGQAVHLKRHLDALMQVSLASASVFDPEQQAAVVLKEIVKLLGAERALILLGEETGELKVIAGQDSEGKDIKDITGFSRTVIEKAKSSKKAIVVSGTEEGEAMGSKSIVAHNLRSIMAAPIILNNKFRGVVYLDSRVAKGIFTKEDVDILLAICNHIGVSLESARAAQSEMKKRDIEKDLELTGAVQSMFLPRENEFSNTQIKLYGYYQPATHCGGDWWQYELLPDGKMRVLIADVVGHGAGPAMITAALAGGYMAIRKGKSTLSTEDELKLLNDNLIRVGDGKYWVSSGLIEIDPDKGELKCWNAGAHPVWVLKPDGALKTFSLASTPLGAGDLEIKTVVAKIEKGDRLFFFTDGVFEFTTANGQYGKPNLKRFMQANRSLPLNEARKKLANEITTLRSVPEAEDDITFAMIDIV